MVHVWISLIRSWCRSVDICASDFSVSLHCVLLFELTLCSCNEGVMVIILSNTLWFVDEFCQNEWIKDSQWSCELCIKQIRSLLLGRFQLRLCLTEQRITIKGLYNHTDWKVVSLLPGFISSVIWRQFCLVHCFFYCHNVVWWLKQHTLLLANIFIQVLCFFLLHYLFCL